MSDRIELKADLSFDDAGTITGIAWPFGIPDSVGDVIVKGAMRLPSALPILNEHDQRQVVGTWETVTETDTGIEVKGRLFIEGVAPARAIREQIRKGVSGGLSIGFSHNGFERLPSGGRKFTEITLTEISICRRPIHRAAGITEVKSEPQDSKDTHMENDVQNETETKAAPHIELKALNDNLGKITARLDKLEAKGNRIPVGEAANDHGFERKAFGNFLRSVGDMGALDATERKALTNATDAAAGFVLAPEDTTREFIRNLVEWSPIRSIADVRTTSSHTVSIPKRLSITNAVWAGETTASTESEPTFGEISLPIRNLTTHVDISDWQVEDSDVAESEVRLALAEDFGKKEAAAFVNGAGALQPEGFMTNADVEQTLNGHASNLSADALITLMYAMPATYRNRGTWLMNGTVLAAIRKLKDSSGAYIWQQSYALGQPETILGRPVMEAKEMADPAANAFPIVFGDFKSAYRIYDRVDLIVKPNPYLLATEGKVRFHARRRVGAAVVRPDALRKLKMAAA